MSWPGRTNKPPGCAPGDGPGLDIEHLADEIEDVARSEKRELASRMAVLLSHLLKWQLQPERRGASWEVTINDQRYRIRRRIRKTPSLDPSLVDPEWIDDAWGDAIEEFRKETGLTNHPRQCPWLMADVLTEDWLPSEP